MLKYIYPYIYFSLHDNGVLNWIMVVAFLSDDDRHFFFLKMLVLVDLTF